MRAGLRSVVVSCALLAVACQGAKGDTGAQGPTGPTGPQGPAGTFSGTTSSPVTFNGGTTINGALSINGQDLFAASMTGLAPAVFGYPYGFGAGHLTCGAPATLDLGATISSSTASYGEIVYTTNGAFNLSQGGNGTFSAACSNVCVGPVTFFLSSPSAQTIVLQGGMDNGPSKIYLDGAVVATPPVNFNQGVNVPAGPFALSLVACSSDGFSTSFYITNSWITTYNLTIDIDRTFHRNGK
jgi:hypothetical protein